MLSAIFVTFTTTETLKLVNLYIALLEISFLLRKIYAQATAAIFPGWVISTLKTLHFRFHKTYGHQLCQ